MPGRPDGPSRRLRCRHQAEGHRPGDRLAHVGHPAVVVPDGVADPLALVVTDREPGAAGGVDLDITGRGGDRGGKGKGGQEAKREDRESGAVDGIISCPWVGRPVAVVVGLVVSPTVCGGGGGVGRLPVPGSALGVAYIRQ